MNDTATDGLHRALADMLDAEDEEIAPGLRMIRHPLVHAPWAPRHTALLNEMYERKLAAFGRAAEAGDRGSMMRLIETPHRLGWICEAIADGLDPETARPLLAEAWIATEFPSLSADRKDLVAAWRAAGFHSDTGLAPPDKPLAVWRGGSRRGLSWTLDPARAEWFAVRFATDARPPAPLWRASADPDCVLAIFVRRGESEIVCDPAMLAGAVRAERTPKKGRGGDDR